MQSSNTPITDEQLAELDRLHAAATKGMNWHEVAFWHAAIAQRYPALRQRLTDAESRLADAERERQRLHDLANRLLDANTGLIDTIRNLDPEALCDWHDSIGGDEYLQQWLAARDARMKRDGAVEWLEADANNADSQLWTREKQLQAAQRLREGGVKCNALNAEGSGIARISVDAVTGSASDVA